MELWIRSQDRMTLCKCNNIYINDEWASPYYIKDDTLTLGKYSTKERALEVLDEIQKQIKYKGKTFLEETGIKEYTGIYEMPEK